MYRILGSQPRWDGRPKWCTQSGFTTKSSLRLQARWMEGPSGDLDAANRFGACIVGF
jgi:hypothetical protein